MESITIKQCIKCVLDTNDVPDLKFNETGFCQYCLAYEETFLINPISDSKKLFLLNQEIKEIKNSKKKYDSILGLSGGVDSSYLAYKAKEWGLNPLLIHFDNGWNSELAVDNINRIVDFTGFDLYTYVVDWEEFKDLQLSYIKASVLDWEVPTDHVIKSILYEMAIKKGIKHILSGTNHQTEFILPHNMRYNKSDSDNILDIHQKFGTKKIKSFKILSPLKEWYYIKTKGIVFHPLLDLIPFDKDEAKQTIAEKMGWRDYGGKHYESIFTRFYQGYVLPVKFGVDKRKAHMASIINSGQITKEQALIELEKPPYPSEEMFKNDFDYVVKKFNLKVDEFKKYIDQAPVPHTYYKQYNSKGLKKFKKLEVYLNPKLYINYLKKKLKK